MGKVSTKKDGHASQLADGRYEDNTYCSARKVQAGSECPAMGAEFLHLHIGRLSMNMRTLARGDAAGRRRTMLSGPLRVRLSRNRVDELSPIVQSMSARIRPSTREAIRDWEGTS